jgi:hypothetical protein
MAKNYGNAPGDFKGSHFNPQDIAFSESEGRSLDNAQEEIGVAEGRGVTSMKGVTNESRSSDHASKNS